MCTSNVPSLWDTGRPSTVTSLTPASELCRGGPTPSLTLVGTKMNELNTNQNNTNQNNTDEDKANENNNANENNVNETNANGNNAQENDANEKNANEKNAKEKNANEKSANRSKKNQSDTSRKSPIRVKVVPVSPVRVKEEPKSPTPEVEDPSYDLTLAQQQQRQQQAEPERNAEVSASNVEDSNETSQPDITESESKDTATANGAEKEGATSTEPAYPQKLIERFSSSSRRRIKAMVKNGMDSEKAREIERERRAQKALADEEAASEILEAGALKRSRSPVDDAEEPLEKRVTESDDGTATLPEQPSTSNLSCQDAVAEESKVAIIHPGHPHTLLKPQQIQLIKSHLLMEIDQITDKNTHPRFVASTVGEGYLSLLCYDNKTRLWLAAALKRIKPYPNPVIKLTDDDESIRIYTCCAYLPGDFNVPKSAFFSRLAKQNPGISTAKWRILTVQPDNRGGQIISFAVDGYSKNKILEKEGKLFLNFSQITVGIQGVNTSVPNQGSGAQGSVPKGTALQGPNAQCLGPQATINWASLPQGIDIRRFF